MSHILIAGCGYVGSELARVLIADGHTVTALRRKPQSTENGVRFVQADLSEPATLVSIPKNIDGVAYTAAADGSTEEAYRRAYVHGLRNLLDFLHARGDAIQRVVFTSTTGVYGQEDGSWVDEDSPTEPDGFTGKVVLDAEHTLHASTFNTVSLRLGGIYGPGRVHLVNMVREGKAFCTPDPPQYSNLNHRDDCAGAVRHLLFLDSPASAYNGVDCEPSVRNEMLCWIADRLGVARPLVAPEEGSRQHRPRGNKRVSSARLRASGFTFQYPSFREGYGPLIDELRATA